MADDLVRLYFERNYNNSVNDIDPIVYNLNNYKRDLWLLSWAILSYNRSKNCIELKDIYENVKNSITKFRIGDKWIKAEDIFFILSVFYRFEIPLERRFLIAQGITDESISSLINASEIIEDPKTGGISLDHSSVADIYFNVFEYYQGLGSSIRNKYRNMDYAYQMFHDYLMSNPFNFLRIFISLRQDVDDNKRGLTIIKSLIEDDKLVSLFSKNINDGQDIAVSSFALLAIADLNKEISLKILNLIDFESLIVKINKDENIDKITMLWINIKNIDADTSVKVINNIEKLKIVQKLIESDLSNIATFLLAFNNINNEFIKKIVKMLCDQKNIPIFEEKLNNENDIFLKIVIFNFIATFETEIARGLIKIIDLNKLISNVSNYEGLVAIQLYISCINNQFRDSATSILGEFNVEKFYNILPYFSNINDFTYTIMSIGLTNKSIGLRLLEIIRINDIERLIVDSDLAGIGLFLFLLHRFDARIGQDIGLNVIDNDIMKDKISSTDDINSLNFFIMSVACIDPIRAYNLYILSLAYAKGKLASDLLISTSPNLDITNHLNNLIIFYNGCGEEIFEEMRRVFDGIMQAKISFKPGR